MLEESTRRVSLGWVLARGAWGPSYAYIKTYHPMPSDIYGGFQTYATEIIAKEQDSSLGRAVQGVAYGVTFPPIETFKVFVDLPVKESQ